MSFKAYYETRNTMDLQEAKLISEIRRTQPWIVTLHLGVVMFQFALSLQRGISHYFRSKKPLKILM